MSRYEKYSKSSRQPTEGRPLDEMVILDNSPYLHHADVLEESAMDMEIQRVESVTFFEILKMIYYHMKVIGLKGEICFN